MKIAFVGKGGTGKSTLSALFTRWMTDQAGLEVLGIDADINMHLGQLLGTDVPDHIHMALPSVATGVKDMLRGSNPRIESADKMLPTTPPGAGSTVLTDINDKALDPFAVPLGIDPASRLMVVGSYDKEGIGQTCYHSHLFIAENLLTHLWPKDGQAVLCDMVAGTDAFAYSMHLQFDAICLIVEPTPESVGVWSLFSELSEEAEMLPLVHIIANKVEDEDDLDYIRQHTEREPIAVIPYISKLKKARQRGGVAELSDLPNAAELFAPVLEAAQNPSLDKVERFGLLKKLHEKLNQKGWVQTGYGDVMGQVDPEGQPPALDTVAEPA
ncbi:MAG: hypothetical protein Alpg2KO_10230 [Alphaproteobacteria bacterium]